MTDARALCEEFGIEIVPRNVAPNHRRTRCPVTIDLILARYGEEHTRLVLSTLTETENNMAILDMSLFWATSDLVRACAPAIEKDASLWLELWDALPIDDLQFMAAKLYGRASIRGVLTGMLYERIYRALGPEAFA